MSHDNSVPPRPAPQSKVAVSHLTIDGEASQEDLAEMLEAEREHIASLRASGPVSSLWVHERILALLQREFSQRDTGPSAPSAAVSSPSLTRLWQAADVQQFSVPLSHRPVIGAGVTAMKRAFIDGLRPFHAEMMRPQRIFNEQLVDLLNAMVSRAWRKDLINKFRLLSTLTDPTRWQVQSHRTRLAAQAVELAKRSYLSAGRGVLAPLLARQRDWNECVVGLLRLCLESEEAPEAEALTRQFDRLLSLVELGPAAGMARVGRGAALELLRRQLEFNREATRQLLGLLAKTPPRALAGLDYADWISLREAKRKAEVAVGLAKLKTRPLISIVIPVYNTPEPVLKACLDSVLAQSYPHWEICAVDDCSPSAAVTQILNAYAQKDRRIQVRRLASNAGIARATNAAVELAKGELVGFLDHDDELTPDALAEMALRLDREPALELVYSDEDRLDEQGRRFGPFFKPDWSPDLLLSVNYVCHFLVVRKSLLDQVGGLREGVDGSQDYDLLLRLSEKTHHIGHISQVLYHWRVSATSTAANPANKPAASNAGLRALRDHLARVGSKALAEAPVPTNYHVRYPLIGEPLVSIIVPFKDKPELLNQLVTSLFQITSYQNFELLLISNNSVQPETAAALERMVDPRIRKLTWDHAFNYSAINNFGARAAKGELLLFLNNDIEITQPDWLQELIGQAQRPEVGAVGPKLLFPDRKLQHAGVILGIGGFASHAFAQLPDQPLWTAFGHQNWVRNYLAVTSACVLMRREVFERIGGYDESFIVCGSDVEICLRMVEAGLRVIYTPYAELIHHESATRRWDSIPENDFWRSFVAYRPYLERGDPFYNPNLSLQSADGALRSDETSAEALALGHLRTLPGAQPPNVPALKVEQQRQIISFLPSLDYKREEGNSVEQDLLDPLARLRIKGRLERITWFLPFFHHPFGGIHTILRLGDLLQKRHGIQSHFVIADSPQADLKSLEAKVRAVMPLDFKGTFQVLRGRDDLPNLAACDLAVATLWTTAYLVKDFEGALAKGYLVQDFEPLFYSASTLYALAEQTYRLGLYGIFNTRGLYESVTANYPMTGCWFEPAVDSTVFHARRPARFGPVKLFFYARPSNDRNGFELGVSALRDLKAEFGERIEIVTAGEHWDPATYGLEGAVTNLGVLPYEKTADLYRQCDVGLVFMFTKHPSYLPFELMACGVTVVTNRNPANAWLLEPDINCLIADPTLTGVRNQLRRAILEPTLRERIARAGSERVSRTTWEAQADRIHASIAHALNPVASESDAAQSSAAL